MRAAIGEEILEVRNALRRDALARRDALNELFRREASARIATDLARMLVSSNARFVHCYISFRSEVETRPLIEDMLARGLRVVVPVVNGDGSENTLIHSELRDLSKLRTGAFGLPEPEERTEVDLEELDAVIVPMVAFDRHGTRLGYGKGFYDRFLRQLPPEVQRIGLAFGMQEVSHIPALPHDERVSTIITENEQITVIIPN